MATEHLNEITKLVNESVFAYCHYITPNDVGATGGHQCGFTFAKPCYKMFFETPGVKGCNKDIFVKIKWQGSQEIESRAIYYGVGTRNEYRITRFGRGFEYFHDDYIGSLQVLAKSPDGEINAYVLSDQDDIEDFMASFDLDVTIGNQIIEKKNKINPDQIIFGEILSFVNSHDYFPDSIEMAAFARHCVNTARGLSGIEIANRADTILLEWTSTEYQLFGALEEKIYRPIYSNPFSDCHELIAFANSILNRRKSRAGKSLEHHLAEIFSSANLRFEEQVITENNKKPDFIFPDGVSYHNILFPANKLTMLGAKTTCKDRWRQVLNEADRIPEKHLFTLQQGISTNQLREMSDEHLTLVVPKANRSLFPTQFQDNVMCLSEFIAMVRERQAL